MGLGRLMLVAAITAVAAGHGMDGQAANPLMVWEPAERVDGEPSDRDDPRQGDQRAPYVAGIIGSSTNAETSVVSSRLPMGDAAIGVAIPRPAGAVRLELEGRQRTALSGKRTVRDSRHEPARVNIDEEWTTMANVWRDVAIGEHAAVYAGGGAGAGGYRTNAVTDGADVSNRVTDIAWQVGGGATYAVTDRVTLDAGYRYYGVGTDRQVEPAGEVVFAVRVADPFRGWLR